MSAPIKGRSAVVKKDTVEIGYCKGVTIGIEAGLIKDYKIGDDDPAVLESGNKGFPITIEKMYIAKTYADLIITTPTKFDLVLLPAGTGDTYTVKNVVLTRWNMRIVQDGIILEGLEGRGDDITLPT